METYEDKSNLLSINKFAKLCRTTPRTIRFYAQKGILLPKYIDPFTKYRYYVADQARDFFKIKLLQNFNTSLQEIENSKSFTLNLLDKKLKKIEEELKEKKKEIEFFKNIKKILFTQDPQKLLKKETLGPYILLCKKLPKGQYDEINSEVYNLISFCKKNKIPITEKQIIFYLDPIAYKPKDTQLEICIVTKLTNIPKTTLTDTLYFKKYKKTFVNSYTYKGPFPYIAQIYQRFHENRQNRKLQPQEIGFDMHLHGPWDKKSEYDHVTKICFPIE